MFFIEFKGGGELVLSLCNKNKICLYLYLFAAIVNDDIKKKF